jgi:hypothetical protein
VREHKDEKDEKGSIIPTESKSILDGPGMVMAHVINREPVQSGPDSRIMEDRLSKLQEETRRQIELNEQLSRQNNLARARADEINRLRTQEELILARAQNRLLANARPYYISDYDRLYNWALAILPDYYTEYQRRQMQNVLERLIKNELQARTPSSRLEDLIRYTINNMKLPANVKTNIVTKPKPSIKTTTKPSKPTSRTKKAAKKSTSRSKKKPTKK